MDRREPRLATLGGGYAAKEKARLCKDCDWFMEGYSIEGKEVRQIGDGSCFAWEADTNALRQCRDLYGHVPDAPCLFRVSRFLKHAAGLNDA